MSKRAIIRFAAVLLAAFVWTLGPAVHAATGSADVRTIETKAHVLMQQNPPDWSGARDEFERAAALGSLRAQSYLGWMYEHGHGVAVDHEAAARHYAVLAEGGVHEFSIKLGWMYLGRSELTPDRARAEHWFRHGIDGGYLPANIALASVLIADAVGGIAVERVDEARSLLEPALESGQSLAAFFLARLYVEGIGGHPQDADLAARYTRISAEDGHPQMQGWLAQMYLDGAGVPVDVREAAFWAALAASGGDQTGARIHQALNETLGDAERQAVLERTVRWALERQAPGWAAERSSGVPQRPGGLD
ncbi:tetratricopeptide repeat protein [Rhodocyclaceae bacterium SMB388]